MIRKRIVGKQSLGLLLVFHEAMSITTACHLGIPLIEGDRHK